MKKTGLLFCVLLFASLGSLSAQVTVEISMAQDEFLPGEAIPVIARITNRSGETVTFGRESGWLKFAIAAKEGYVAMRQSDVPTQNEFTLQSSEYANVRLNLAPYFQLDKTGHYQITATVSVPEWKKSFNSDAKALDIIKGARVWQQEFGVPRTDDANSEPQLRIYALQEANYLRGRHILYAQVTDAGGRVNSVTPIGPMISFGQPEAKVDKNSNLHILYQNGPRSFNHSVVSPDCQLIKREFYDYTSRPRMVADNNGFISIEGGTRRVTHEDLPAPKVSAVNDAPAPIIP